jgi:hypothetical protein
MIEPMGVLMLGYEGENELSIFLGDEHDEVVFRFITLVGGATGETLRFEASEGMTVADFFDALDEEESETEIAILDFLEKEKNAAVLVAFDGEPRIFAVDNDA